MNRRPSQSLRAQTARRRAAWLLAFVLLAVQTLGALHRIAHVERVGFGSTFATVAATPAPATVAVASSRDHGWLDALFAGHAGRDCDAFDQMSHADLAVGTTLDLAAAPPAQSPAAAHPAWHIAAQARGFLARGPPVTA